jgi:L-ascorbate metabolism protein UlaG (beta-lactamase superfamily)
MDIIWYGHACCGLFGETTRVITDPYDESLGISPPRLSADIVTVSHRSPRHSAVQSVSGEFKVVDRPGEYEIGGIFITGNALYPGGISETDHLAQRNIIFVYEIGGIKVCHLGDLSHVPTPSQMEMLASVDVLLVPVGGGRSLNAAQAAELVSLIEPSIVVPIHYALPNMSIILDPVDRFLKEMGSTQREGQAKLSLRSGSLPLETQVVLLNPTVN